MSAPESAGSGSSPDLFTSLRTFWGVVVAIFYTRLDLATLELEEEAIRAIQLVFIILAAMLAIGMTIFFLCFFLVAFFWEERNIVLPIIFTVCALGSTILVLVARKMIQTRPKFLSHTLNELRKDVEGLRPVPVVKVEEPKP